MYSKDKVSNLSKDKYTIKAQSTQTINFMGARPNYYRITNSGTSDLFLGVTMSPTKKFFDMKIPTASTKLYVDAYGHDNIYIYNPSTEDANIIITSFEAEFDPTVLALTDSGEDFSSLEINANSVITGFECELPSGDNVIGKVGLIDDVVNILNDIKNKKVDLTTCNNALSDINTKLEETNRKISSIGQNTDSIKMDCLDMALKMSENVIPDLTFIKSTVDSRLTDISDYTSQTVYYISNDIKALLEDIKNKQDEIKVSIPVSSFIKSGEGYSIDFIIPEGYYLYKIKCYNLNTQYFHNLSEFIDMDISNLPAGVTQLDFTDICNGKPLFNIADKECMYSLYINDGEKLYSDDNLLFEYRKISLYYLEQQYKLLENLSVGTASNLATNVKEPI